MPAVAERIDLARRTMVGLAQGSELPPKLGVHPREPESHTAAMPALFRGRAEDGTDDLLGMKWVTAFADNRSRGMDAIHATVVLSDARTGQPQAIVDGGPITAQRTAAVSGVALAEWLPADARGLRVALLGAGVQGRAHVDVLAHVAEGCSLAVVDRTEERAQGLAEAARATGRFDDVSSMTDAPAACAEADVVLTMVSFGPERQQIPARAFDRARVIVAVDYDMCVPASVAERSSLFVTDDIAQFKVTRQGSVFVGYPDPDASMGEALLGRAPAPRASGPMFVNHLGVGLADVVFADAILRRAVATGAGMELPR
jgi:ornithine cyclodeaminase/alanine dehydrogenase-like protein (mu-crystallin family)